MLQQHHTLMYVKGRRNENLHLTRVALERQLPEKLNTIFLFLNLLHAESARSIFFMQNEKKDLSLVG